MKVVNIFLVSLLAVILTGCGTKKEVHYVREKKIETEVVSPEDSLLRYPCKAVVASGGAINLALDFNKNVKCIKLYQRQIDKIRKDVDSKERQNDK